jgi:hypothetical protein
MSQQFEVSNTVNDITNAGPVAQEIALHKGALIPVDLSVASTQPLSFGSLKQAALGTTIIINFQADGDETVFLTLNKKTGAANGTVARALQEELLLKRIGDKALCHFYSSNFPPLSMDGDLRVSSDDTSVTPANIILFQGMLPEKARGEAVLEIEATAVPPNAPTVRLDSGNNAHAIFP